jgi:hypothetical protein
MFDMTNLSRFLMTFPEKEPPFQTFPTPFWKGFSYENTPLSNRANVNPKEGAWQNFFSRFPFSLKKQMTHPKTRSIKPVCHPATQTLRDSRHLSKRLAHSHALPPQRKNIFVAVLVTSHNIGHVKLERTPTQHARANIMRHLAGVILSSEKNETR